MPNQTPKTIKFNVGGKRFEVSRDLIIRDSDNGETMLSRLVSSTWMEDPKSEVFIDRDGDRFTYVLDYLRYGEVTLPMNISETLFYKDLDFFGIAVGESGLIRKENRYMSDTLTRIHEAEKEKKHFLLALDIVKDFASNPRERFEYRLTSQNLYCCQILGKSVKEDDYDGEMLNKQLARFGYKIFDWGTKQYQSSLRALN